MGQSYEQMMIRDEGTTPPKTTKNGDRVVAAYNKRRDPLFSKASMEAPYPNIKVQKLEEPILQQTQQNLNTVYEQQN